MSGLIEVARALLAANPWRGADLGKRLRGEDPVAYDQGVKAFGSLVGYLAAEFGEELAVVRSQNGDVQLSLNPAPRELESPGSSPADLSSDVSRKSLMSSADARAIPPRTTATSLLRTLLSPNSPYQVLVDPASCEFRLIRRGDPVASPDWIVIPSVEASELNRRVRAVVNGVADPTRRQMLSERMDRGEWSGLGPKGGAAFERRLATVRRAFVEEHLRAALAARGFDAAAIDRMVASLGQRTDALADGGRGAVETRVKPRESTRRIAELLDYARTNLSSEQIRDFLLPILGELLDRSRQG